jgi:hypothetical protein
VIKDRTRSGQLRPRSCDPGRCGSEELQSECVDEMMRLKVLIKIDRATGYFGRLDQTGIDKVELCST